MPTGRSMPAGRSRFVPPVALPRCHADALPRARVPGSYAVRRLWEATYPVLDWANEAAVKSMIKGALLAVGRSNGPGTVKAGAWHGERSLW